MFYYKNVPIQISRKFQGKKGGVAKIDFFCTFSLFPREREGWGGQTTKTGLGMLKTISTDLPQKNPFARNTQKGT